MIKQEVNRVAGLLETQGHALTTFDALDLPDHRKRTEQLVSAVEKTEQYSDSKARGRTGMLMFREPEVLSAGKLVMEPIVEKLFYNYSEISEALGMYAVNQYEKGDFFNPHQDHFDGTVIIATPQGVRNLDIYAPEEEDDEFVDVTHSYELAEGSVMLLNGFMNLGHAAQCTHGPSLSVVSDVPYQLEAR